MKNEKLFEAQTEFEQMNEGLRKLNKDNEKNLERQMTLLNKQFRNDVENYRNNLHERRDLKQNQVREDLDSQLNTKKSEFDKVKLENQEKNDQNKQILLKGLHNKITSDKEKASIEH